MSEHQGTLTSTRPARHDGGPLSLTVVVPTKNAARTLASCLHRSVPDRPTPHPRPPQHVHLGSNRHCSGSDISPGAPLRARPALTGPAQSFSTDQRRTWGWDVPAPQAERVLLTLYLDLANPNAFPPSPAHSQRWRAGTRTLRPIALIRLPCYAPRIHVPSSHN
jgi:hypothetical protein